MIIADDSAVARALLRNILENDHDIEIVGEAGDGVEAVQRVRILKPHLLMLDLDMPVMGGLDAIVEIMASHPVPILVVSNMADAQNSCIAIERGALDVLSKPRPGSPECVELIAKVKLLAKVQVISHVRPPFSKNFSDSAKTQRLFNQKTVSASNQAGVPAPDSESQRVFAIASSTGGPQVLAQILGQLPATFPCPVFIAQHIAYGFAPGMVKWLDGLSQMPVCLAEEGKSITPATVYLAPSEFNLAISRARRLCLNRPPATEMYHPSCDELLGSVADVYGRQSVGIILTGMGRDGAMGMERIHRAGGITLAQDEASSVVFGMNKIAIDRGAVQHVLAVNQIAREMCRLAGITGA